MSVREETQSKLTQTDVFDVTRRGYDPQQVDAHMRALVSRLAEAEKAQQREHERADRAEAELRNARVQLQQLGSQPTEGRNSGTQEGFGYRVEKLLRLAEQEAAEVRSTAAREATALLERAREEAEAHRHDVEQSLIARVAKLDQETAQRKVELDERERLIAEQSVAAREEAERAASEIKRHAEQIHQDAQARAEELQLRAEKAIRERHEAAEKELRRLRALHDGVRGELARLLESLAGEFTTTSGPQQPRPLPAGTPHVADQSWSSQD